MNPSKLTYSNTQGDNKKLTQRLLLIEINK